MTLYRVLTGAAVAIGTAVAVWLYVAFGAFLPWREQAEAEQMMDVAGIGPGQAVADIGAGGGRFTAALARRVGRSGRVFATDTSEHAREQLRARASHEDLANIVVGEAHAAGTNLPAGCCDVMLLRNVYHHVGDPETFNRSLHETVRPGGRVVVIDFEPGALPLHGAAAGSSRHGGHGVRRADATAELRAAGFRIVREIADWSGPLWLVLAARE